MYFFQITLGILIGMAFVVPYLEWLGVPSFANLLVYLFGEPNGVNKFVAGFFGLIVVLIIVLFPIKKFKKSSNY